MPLLKCQVNGKMGWKYGASGKCFVGPQGKSKATIQGRAIEANRSRSDGPEQGMFQLQRRRLQAEKPKKKLPKNLPVWQFPKPAERWYEGQLVDFVNMMAARVATVVIPNLQSIADERNLIVPVPARSDDYADSLARLMQALSVSFSTIPFDKAAVARMAANQTNAWNDKEWQKQLKAAFGVDILQREPWLNSSLNAFTRENVVLITRMQADYLSEVERIASSGFRQGQPISAISKQLIDDPKLMKSLGVGIKEFEQERGRKFPVKGKDLTAKTKNRARLIASDQVGKLNGELTELRQTNLGVESYTWRTSLDERVRPTHDDREGKVYKWTDPPPDGNPGESIRCRCYASPLFDDIFKELAQ